MISISPLQKGATLDPISTWIDSPPKYDVHAMSSVNPPYISNVKYTYL